VSWGEVFLGLIALATLTNAAVQVGVLLVASRHVRRLQHLATRLEHDLKPLLGHVNMVGRELSRAASLAAAQVERADALVADLVSRGDRALGVIEASAAVPAREGAALMRGFKAALEALRGRRSGRSGTRSEDEDALFI
jgi:hypothetical protein